MYTKILKKSLLVTSVFMIASCASLQQELNKYVKKPEVNYKSIAVGKVAMDGIELNPTFNILNKNSFSLPIDTIDYAFSLNNKSMLSGETDSIGSLPANNDKDVTLSLNLTKETLSALQQLLFKNKQLDYQVKGHVNAMGLSIPFEKSDTLYVPEVKVVGLKVTDASFSQFSFVLDIDVDNKNDFTLPLESINYSASSKGKMLFDGKLISQKIAKGKNTIQLPLSIKLDQVFANGFSLLLNPNLPLHFEVSSPLFTKSYDQSLNIGSFFR